jgi:hypothetical protein
LMKLTAGRRPRFGRGPEVESEVVLVLRLVGPANRIDRR